VRRHRLPVLALASILLALGVGLAAALWQASEARAQAQRAEAVQRLLVRLFQASHPEQAQGRQMNVRELLDQGAARIAGELVEQPGLRASLHLELARIYSALGGNRESLAQARQALQLLQTQGHGDGDEAFDAALLEIEALKEEYQYGPAKQAVLALQKRALARHGPGHRWALPLAEMQAWIAVQQGDVVQAETITRQALAEAGDGLDATRIRLRSVLAHALLEQSRTREARAEFAAVVGDSARVPDYDQTDRLADHYNLARARYLMGEYAEVAAALRELVPVFERHLGRPHDRVMKARSLWAQAEAQAGRPLAAVDIQRETLAVALARDAFDDSQLSLQRVTLAKLLRQAGRAAEGLPLAEFGLAHFDRQLSEPTWLRERGRWIVGELLLATGRLAPAIQQFDRSEGHMRQLAGYAKNALYGDLLLSRAMALKRRAGPGDTTRARRDAEQALVLQRQAHGAASGAAQQAEAVLAWLHGDAAALQQVLKAWQGATPLQQAGVGLLLAELQDGAAALATRESAAARWQQALRQPAPARLMNPP
jgi:hypothetical protein